MAVANKIAKTKRRKEIFEKLIPGKVYIFADAIALLQSLPKAKFNETIEISVNLGVDARKSEQSVRGSIVMPHGTGKTVRVAVFAQGSNAEKAKEAGADIVGMDDLAESIKAGDMNFDVVIASPDAMGVVGRLGQILGPRGLMPNPKVGTVTPDVSKAVKNAKSGQIRYRTDKNGIIHCGIGKIDFAVNALEENFVALLQDLRKSKPSTSKGVYFQKATVSTTHGPGLSIDLVEMNF